MREIKFRAWDKENKSMKNVQEMFFNYENRWVVTSEVIDLDAPIMQYTGLKDKNGTPIYEGDILNMIYHGGVTVVKPEIKGVVSFYGASFVAGEEKIPFDRIGRSLEVIGNIYEGENK